MSSLYAGVYLASSNAPPSRFLFNAAEFTIFATFHLQNPALPQEPCSTSQEVERGQIEHA
ncbi:hypothetical protein N7540_001068 [Penicillium herquei]|nr:hypothetical protein N7540_001068 [Penicillium herquei]